MAEMCICAAVCSWWSRTGFHCRVVDFTRHSLFDWLDQTAFGFLFVFCVRHTNSLKRIRIRMPLKNHQHCNEIWLQFIFQHPETTV